MRNGTRPPHPTSRPRAAPPERVVAKCASSAAATKPAQKDASTTRKEYRAAASFGFLQIYAHSTEESERPRIGRHIRASLHGDVRRPEMVGREESWLER